MRFAVASLTTTLVLAASGPCDIFSSGGTPCVAAHSLVRALFGAFGGSLYQVKRLSDNATLDIGVIAVGGFANSKAQDQFCGSAACIINTIYDQVLSLSCASCTHLPFTF